MKNVVVRITAIAVLATSFSAFALSNQRNSDTNSSNAISAPTTEACPADVQKSCVVPCQDPKKSKEDLQRDNKIKQQDKDWLKALEAIHG